MAPPPLYDKWYVLAEMASVPSQLVDEVEPVLGPANERGRLTSRLPSGWRSGTFRGTAETTAWTGDSGRCSATAGLRAERIAGQAWACPFFLVPGVAVVSGVKGSPGGAVARSAMRSTLAMSSD